MRKIWTKNDLIDKFSETLGREKAIALITEVLEALPVSRSGSYIKEDVVLIAKKLREQGGFIGIIATCLLSEAHRMGR